MLMKALKKKALKDISLIVSLTGTTNKYLGLLRDTRHSPTKIEPHPSQN